MNSSSILRFRVASSTEIPGTVPVNVLNQSWPVFVFPDIYLDGGSLTKAKYVESGPEDIDTVSLTIGADGCNRLNALSDDLNLTVVMFIDNYPINNIAIHTKLHTAEIVVDCFPTNEQAKYFYEAICKEIT